MFPCKKETDMPDEQTCGKGLAENSVLPAKVSELIDALAENLDLHLTTLDLTDENSKREDDVYRMLVREYSGVAARLEKTAKRMAGFRDLPMGRHDAEAIRDLKHFEAFKHFVTVEEELLHLLQMRVEQDREVLIEMGKVAG
jgi:hypothetical protein